MIFKNVLVLSPHTDDAELSCGGFIARLKEEDASVTVYAFSSCKNDVIEIEFKQSMQSLRVDHYHIGKFEFRNFNFQRQSILDQIRYLISLDRYDLILSPCEFDNHQDHKVIYEETRRATRDTTIFGYECSWNHIEFKNSVFISLTKNHLESKIRALSFYKTQKNKLYFSSTFILSLATVRGVQSKRELSEVFQPIQIIF